MIIVVLNSLIGWFPNGQGSGGPWQWFIYIIFPALVLGLAALVTFTRFVRSEVLEVLHQDYVRTAHAKGLPGPRVTGLMSCATRCCPSSRSWATCCRSCSPAR